MLVMSSQRKPESAGAKTATIGRMGAPVARLSGPDFVALPSRDAATWSVMLRIETIPVTKATS